MTTLWPATLSSPPLWPCVLLCISGDQLQMMVVKDTGASKGCGPLQGVHCTTVALASLFGSSSAGSSSCRIEGQGALRTRGLTSSFPVTENMRARPSGVHTVGTGASHLPDPALHCFPCLPLYSLPHPGCSGPRMLLFPSQALDTHPGGAAPQGRRCRSRGRGGSTPRSLKAKGEKHQSTSLLLLAGG